MLYKEATINLICQWPSKQRRPGNERQEDPISCPLFVVVIDGLACCINRISGLETDGHTIKTLLYADDTVDLIRNQQEAYATLEWLDLYGARANQGKSCLLQVGNPEIITSEVQQVSPENPYVHLGIPVGTDLERHLQNYWERIIMGIRSKWRRFICHSMLIGEVSNPTAQ